MINDAVRMVRNDGFKRLLLRANIKFNPLMPYVYCVDPCSCKTSEQKIFSGSVRAFKSRRFSGLDGLDRSGWDQPEINDIGRVWDRELITSIRSRLDAAIDSGESTYQITYDGEVYSEQLYSHEFKGRNAFDFATEMPGVAELVNNPLIVSLLEQYYQSHFAPIGVRVYRNYHVPPEVQRASSLYSSRWHFDGREPDMIKLFVALDDITENDGPLHVLSREDSIKVSHSDQYVPDEGVAHKFIESNYEIITHTGPAGSAMLANTNLCLHRAGYPAAGNSRDLAQIKFISASHPVAEDWLTNDNYPLHGGY